jgi:hypothetical protein
MNTWDAIADLNKIFKQYDRLNQSNELNKVLEEMAPHLAIAMPSKEISAFYDSIKGLVPSTLLEMKDYVSKLDTLSEFVNPFKSILDNNILIKSNIDQINAFSEFVNPLKSILDNNILIKSNIDQLIKDMSPFSSSLSILNQISSSYCDTIFKQKEAFMQISYLRPYEKRSLLRHEHNQQKALIVGQDDLENTEILKFNVVNTIRFIDSLAEINDHNVDDADIADDIENELDEILKSHGRGYLEVLAGAKQAANGDNPDKIRHTTTSLRELSTRILHDLSPDEQIKKWSNKKEDYSDGRPTRRCRVAYIFRNLTHSKAAPLIENDIKFIADFFNFFNKGTHELMPALSVDELKYLIYKTESTILLLLKYSQKK